MLPASFINSDITSTRNTTFAIPRQLVQFASDTINMGSESSALLTKKDSSLDFSQFFKMPSCTLGFSFESHDSFTKKRFHTRKGNRILLAFSTFRWAISQQRKKGCALPQCTCSTEAKMLWREDMMPPPNKLVNYMCLCVCAIFYHYFLSLTLSLTSLSAPAPKRSCTISVWPLFRASMSAVLPF